MTEIWRDIPGYEGRYQASNEGRIKSLARTREQLNRWGSKTVYESQEKILANNHCRKNGYACVGLVSPITNKHTNPDVHRIIALTFIGPANGQHVRHIDGNKTNNRADNLCYGSAFDNAVDKIKHGRQNTQKLTIEDVLEIRRRIEAGELMTNLHREYGISYTNMKLLKRRKTWSFI